MLGIRRALLCALVTTTALSAPHGDREDVPADLLWAGSRLGVGLDASGGLAAGLSDGALADRVVVPGSGLRPPTPPEVGRRVAALPADPEQVRRPARASRTRPSYSVLRGSRSLAALDWPWQELGYTVVFRPYRGRYLGLTDARSRTITVFVRPGEVEGELRTTLAHEIGHALDAVTGTPERRRAYLELRGIDPSTPWYPCNRCDDLRSPAGDFAETFARWLVGPGHVRRTLAPAPDAEQLRALDAFYAPLSARQG